MRKGTKSLAIIITAAMLVGGCGNAASGESKSASAGSHKISQKETSVYLGSLSNKVEIPLYFMDEGTVPYLEMEDVHGILSMSKFDRSYDDTKDHVILTKKGTGYTADFDFKNDTISFFDYDAFFQKEGAPLVDIGSLDIRDLSQKQENISNDRYGRSQTFDLKKYGIDMIREGDAHFVPLQTISDVMISYQNGMILYNGEAVFMTSELSGDMEEEYYKAPKDGTLSEDMALYSYNELCFALDNLYGLKEIHNITDFDKFFTEIGFEKMLKSTDVLVKEEALYRFITCYLDDIHSSYNNNSYLVEKADLKERIGGIKGPSKDNYKNARDLFEGERKKALSEKISPYQEVGNTAYITFDEFTNPSATLDYKTEPKEDELEDTIRLMQYACEKILRPGSPIKNVVMDLSLNGGGACAAASYVIGTYLGTGEINTINTLTGATTTLKYSIDTNRDGVFDEKDTLAGKGLNLYCMISPVSFSCGNFVPNTFVSSPTVTLLGITSGGGSCTVQPMSSAYGSSFQISGSRRLSVFKNGSFYDIDRGATPDYTISKIEDFYNREKLTNYINGLI